MKVKLGEKEREVARAYYPHAVVYHQGTTSAAASYLKLMYVVDTVIVRSTVHMLHMCTAICIHNTRTYLYDIQW